jgi:hypothetical protein
MQVTCSMPLLAIRVPLVESIRPAENRAASADR